MRRPISTAVAIALFASAPALARPADPIASAVSGPQRSDASKARDQYRHPVETLEFFGLKPGMTVVEVSPSGGWYTEILAPLLRDHGQLIAAHNNPAAGEGSAKSVQKFRDKLAAMPAVYDKVRITAFGKDAYAIAPPASADMVLTFRNIHNWVEAGYAPAAFRAFYAALKPGGVLGIEEHRLPEDRPGTAQASSGYMKVSTVRKLAEAAGFRFAGASNVNANPKDTHDYPKGVWTLPPTYTEGGKDRAKYAAIGESDRMTLKFFKPR